MDVRFTPMRFGVGYDQTEVDDFLDRCERALTTGDGSVTVQTVREARFSQTRFSEGYAMDEVDRFLDDVLTPRFLALEDGAAVPAEEGVGAEPPSPQPRGVRGTGTQDPATAPSQRGPVPHPAEQRGGFLSRLFRGR